MSPNTCNPCLRSKQWEGEGAGLVCDPAAGLTNDLDLLSAEPHYMFSIAPTNAPLAVVFSGSFAR